MDAFEAARRALLEKLTNHASRVRGSSAVPVRIATELAEPIDPLVWLTGRQEKIRGYWADREGEREVAAIGEADEIKGDSVGAFAECIGELERRLQDAPPEIRYYGGFRFGPRESIDNAWRPFLAYRFIMPAIEVVRRPDGAELACTIGPGGGVDAVRRAIARLAVVSGPGVREVKAREIRVGIRARAETPTADQWGEMARRALEAIRQGSLQKVVLARRVCFELDGAVEPFHLAQKIRAESGRCFLYAGAHAAGFAFVGASPERLFKREAKKILTEAVAGTRPRGRGAAEDERLAEELAADSKERQEHQLVAGGIAEALAPLCERVHAAPVPAVLKLANVMHLRTPVEAVLRDGVGTADVLEALHPTPALGGYPRAMARRLIDELEPFDRGWYAGPIGWVSRDAAEFAVAIRCALVAGNRLCLFAGAGLVEGSEPEREWAEMEAKLSLLLNLIGANG